MKPKQLNFVDGRAETPFGDYVIERFLGMWFFAFRSAAVDGEEHRTKAEAIAAAQADFERRARECFEDVQQKGEQ